MPDTFPSKTAVIVFICLLFPALFINLDQPAIAADEPTRAIVAMEMMYSHNYLISTIAGEYYYKKPPLFNWILVGFYEATGSRSEFVTRLAAVIPLLLFAWRIFRVLRKRVTPGVALLTAVLSLTFGRMLYYDSMLGHIDILYGWITFESFIVLYRYFESGKPFRLLLIFWLLHAAGMMLKGLPSLLFPVFTFAAMAWHKKEYRWLFSWQQVVAFLIAAAGPFLFFYIYAQHNSLQGWMEQLWDQSKQRTVMDKTWLESVQHLYLFPLDHLMHLAPWSVFVVCFFAGGYKKRLAGQPFLRYLLLVLLFNLPVYWASPGYYPRYLFMLYPLVFVLLSDAFMMHAEHDTKMHKVLNRVLLLLMLIICVAFAAIAVYMQLTVWSAVIVLLLLVACTWMAWKQQRELVWYFAAFVLVTRIGFDFYVIPDRVATGENDHYKNEALRVIEKSKGQPLYLCPGSWAQQDFVYYAERERGEILTFHTPDTTSLFLYRPGMIPEAKFEVLDTFYFKWENLQMLLVKFDSLPAALPLLPEDLAVR